jgi:hypothetical protein
MYDSFDIWHTITPFSYFILLPVHYPFLCSHTYKTIIDCTIKIPLFCPTFVSTSSRIRLRFHMPPL